MANSRLGNSGGGKVTEHAEERQSRACVKNCESFMVTDKRQGQWMQGLLMPVDLEKGRPLGERKYMACHAENLRVSVQGSHRKVLDRGMTGQLRIL